MVESMVSYSTASGDAMLKRAWELMVWDIPKPQARKRIQIKKGDVELYPEKKDDEARYQIRRHWIEAYGQDPLLLECDFAMSLVVALPCPTTVSRKRRLAGARPRGQRSGDVDNYLKAVMDALRRYAYVDDSQIQELREPVKKVYAIDTKTGRDMRPYLWIRLEEL